MSGKPCQEMPHRLARLQGFRLSSRAGENLQFSVHQVPINWDLQIASLWGVSETRADFRFSLLGGTMNKIRKPHETPKIGIFWLVGRRLILDTIPLSEAGNYGDSKIYEGDHVTHWEELERRCEVPPDSDYEEFPRGRVNFNTKTQQFTLFLDRCILRKKDVVKSLLRLMCLPTIPRFQRTGTIGASAVLQESNIEIRPEITGVW